MILGSAIDIVERCGVPRFYFVDFPLGNPCGKPYDQEMQGSIVSKALSLFVSASEARTVVKDPNRWGSEEWRERYMEINPEDREKMLRQGEERRRKRQHLRDIGHTRKD
ncbi:MAG: hypothetical protein OXG05_01610 [Gammaproteobacteria bacterium]|nr:hypothetical protein [Gammaproteobacteria bacterium]